MPPRELSLWAAVLSREPPAEERLEILLATFAAMVYNQRAGRGKGKKKTADFLFFKDAFKYRPKSSGNPDVDSDIKTLMEAFAPMLHIRPRETG